MNTDESDTTANSFHPSSFGTSNKNIDDGIISERLKTTIVKGPKPISILSKKTVSYVYSNKFPRRGMCLIISVDTFDDVLKLPSRPGTEVDINMIVDTFSALEYETYLLKNPSSKSMVSAIKKMSLRNHLDSESFVCFILTHGDEGGMVFARDGTVSIEKLIEPFRGMNCSDLLGKPKLFFIQACRGTCLDDGVTFSETDGTYTEDMTMSAFKKIPIEADMLVAYAVQQGYYAFRNSIAGSWFIQALTYCLDSYGRSLDLLSIMTRVNNRVAFEFESSASNQEFSGKKQMPSIVSTLTKDYFFKPKPKPFTKFDQ